MPNPESRVPHPEADRFPLLFRIDLPTDLRRLPEGRLPELADELRGFLIDSVSRTGGHLAAGLGVVDLTIALHYVFDTPNDRLIWDVGHQAYPHKILTGRRARMGSLRKRGGLAGFPRRDESPYDTFGVGHSSTSVSAALGMALAVRAKGESRQTIAVIGDGALGAGMAFEALSHAGSLESNLLVILNDNGMSISPPVGTISSHLVRLLSGKLYTKVREGGKSVLRRLPPLKAFMGRWEEHLKGMVMPGTLFEELGFNYIGPIDGHDMGGLLTTLRNMKTMPGPRFLHLVTRKGRGYKPAERQPVIYHGAIPFDLKTGALRKQAGTLTYTRVFGDWLYDSALADRRLIGITPAMGEGSGLTRFAANFPDRYLDVGIAEQHALTLAAGLACEGLKPVVAVYSTFLQRAYDQLIHDICLQDLDVTLAVDRAGLVGADGATHAGSFDLSYGRIVPNLVIMAPADEDECRRMLQTAFQYPGPAMVRYPRGAGPGVPVAPGLQVLPLGKSELRRTGRTVALLAFGTLVAPALEVAETQDATVVNMRFIKPLDEGLILELARAHRLLVTLEENAVAGGAGTAVSELLAARQIATRCLHLGLPDCFLDQATRQEQLADCSLDAAGIGAAVRNALAKHGAVERPRQD